MRVLCALVAVATCSASVAAQTLAPKPSSLQHVTAEATTSAPLVARGEGVTLWVDVTPKPNIHVYASDRQGFTPVTLVLTPLPGVKTTRVKYPASELQPTLGLATPVPVYRRPFRLALPVTIGAPFGSGDSVTISGALNYQACDDRLCYPVASLPVSWTVNVR